MLTAAHPLAHLIRDAAYYQEFHERLAAAYRRCHLTCSLATTLASAGAVLTLMQQIGSLAPLLMASAAAVISACSLVIRFDLLTAAHSDTARRYLTILHDCEAKLHASRSSDEVDVEGIRKAMRDARMQEPASRPPGAHRLAKAVQEAINLRYPPEFFAA